MGVYARYQREQRLRVALAAILHTSLLHFISSDRWMLKISRLRDEEERLGSQGLVGAGLGCKEGVFMASMRFFLVNFVRKILRGSSFSNA